MRNVTEHPRLLQGQTRFAQEEENGGIPVGGPGTDPVDASAVDESNPSKRCNFKFIKEIRGDIASEDGHQLHGLHKLPLVRNAFGLNWYSQCSGDHDYWDKDFQERKELFLPNRRRNLLYSSEWRDARPTQEGCGMVLLICNYYLKWKTDASGNNGKRAHFQQYIDSSIGMRYRYIKNGTVRGSTR